MCSLFSDVAWLANVTGVSIEYAYNELMDCDGDIEEAISYCKFSKPH